LQIRAIGILIYEIVFEAATQFHHSNFKMPLQLEKALNNIIVTPRMHGVYYLMVKEETNSNYSVIFSFWNRMNKIARLNVPQNEIVIGLPQNANETELTIGNLLKMPFTKIRQ